MKKLLFVVNVDWFFVSHRLPIALAAIKNGFEVHLACSLTDKKEELENCGVKVHPLTLSRSGLNLMEEIRSLKGIYDVVNLLKPDVVHFVTIKPVLYGNIICRFLRVPKRVSSISGLGFVFIAKGFKAFLLRRFVFLLYRLALKGSDRIIFQNSADRDSLKAIGAVSKEQECFIRGSGVNLEDYPVTQEPDGLPVVMFLARLLIDKGVVEFVEAAKLIKKKRTDIRMILVGDVDFGNPKSVSSKALQEWVEQGVVEHWGYRINVADTIAESNIIVLPSYREGLPKSLIEAAACGRAVITTNVPGCRDAIEDNVTGLLVPVKSVKPLAEAILKLVQDKNLRFKLASSGRKLAESAFDINDVIRIHLSIYNKF
ncbi:glycosyltransferase family 4 protein [Shewanella sp. ECSMB14102]|uniref:glycosyltransferase family 4 protein n=1 Tax=Shewanella sp. ECSMB14102 TaxID=1579504 RepID=UPI000579DEDD|nr:glycosyltransferase family 4 protein [Shewanella sp. ECSMB14102]